jgi:glycosyltransferase involved in cell wall biosynthesis
MRVLVTTVQVPFIRGGAENHAEGLVNAMTKRGVDAELVTMPFRFQPPLEVIASMDSWQAQSFDRQACGPIDRVICLRFPTYYSQHPRKVVWLIHQHRSVYELFNTQYGEKETTPNALRLRDEVLRRDTESLAAARVFANSRRVAERLLQYNGLTSTPLYHPPPNADRYFEGDQFPYIFAPSRLESLKRHELLLRAMTHVEYPIMLLIGGEGGMRGHLEEVAAQLGLRHRVRFLGHLGPVDMIPLYANCLGVFFGPYDEDLGYITLEAMLSSKPVITCSDSGGPLEFVSHGDNGLVVAPMQEEIAAAINRLGRDRAFARALGSAGREKYTGLGISWDRVVDTLLE